MTRRLPATILATLAAAGIAIAQDDTKPAVYYYGPRVLRSPVGHPTQVGGLPPGVTRVEADAPATAVTGAFTREDGVALIGGSPNLRYYRGTTAQACEADCAADGRCVAYTFVRAGGYRPGDPAMCYLQSGLGPKSSHPCCFTGTRTSALPPPAAPSGCTIDGRWEQSTPGVGASVWTITRQADGAYRAVEQGLAGATGTATVNGNQLRIDWQAGGGRGYYQWNLPNCGGGTGSLVFLAGASGTHASTVTRPGQMAPGIDISGVWIDNTESFGQSRWTFTPIGGGRYSAVQQGLGGVSGTAVVTGRHVRVDWSSGGWTAFIEFDLDATGSSASGFLTITQGRPGRYGVTMTRQAAQPAAAIDISGVWIDNTESFGQSRWTFTPMGGGRYSAVQRGLGGVSGTAVVTGRHVRVDWSSGGWTAFIELDVDAMGSSASGFLTITQGRPGRYGVTMTRQGAQAAAAIDISGVWTDNTESFGQSRWTLTPLGGGRYSAVQQGLGGVSGTAVVTGRRVRVDWSSGGWTAFIELDVDATGSSASGFLTITQGRPGRYGVTMTRQGAQAAAAIDISGVWTDNTESFGQSRWTFRPIGVGRYSAVQQGLGGVSGTAVVTGRHVRVDWSSGGWTAFIEFDVDATGSSASGFLTITQGRPGRYGVTMTRELKQ